MPKLIGLGLSKTEKRPKKRVFQSNPASAKKQKKDNAAVRFIRFTEIT